jgi:hypothetical protein
VSAQKCKQNDFILKEINAKIPAINMFNYMKLIPEVKISIDSKSVVKDEGS